MGIVSLKGRLLCKNAAEAAVVKKLLPRHIRRTKAEPGCLSFSITATEDPWVWLVHEEFEDAAAFEAHQQRVAKSKWGRATAGVQRIYKIKGI